MPYIYSGKELSFAPLVKVVISHAGEVTMCASEKSGSALDKNNREKRIETNL